jgi:hypothetical protein
LCDGHVPNPNHLGVWVLGLYLSPISKLIIPLMFAYDSLLSSFLALFQIFIYYVQRKKNRLLCFILSGTKWGKFDTWQCGALNYVFTSLHVYECILIIKKRFETKESFANQTSMMNFDIGPKRKRFGFDRCPTATDFLFSVIHTKTSNLQPDYQRFRLMFRVIQNNKT